MHVYQCPKCPARVSLGIHIIPTCDVCSFTMLPLSEQEQALVPMDPAFGTPAGIGPFTVHALRGAGILMPATQDALEWMYRHRARNGMAEAFCKVGGRRCIDLVAFARLVRGKRA